MTIQSQTLSQSDQPTSPLGWQTPPIFTRQTYVDTLGDEALAFLGDLGLSYDPWQELVIREMLGVKADGKWASPDIGLVVGRQNGKSEIAVARILIGLFLIGEPLIVYSAHQADTAEEIFRRLVGIIGDDESSNPNQWLHKYIKHVWWANGRQGIELYNGCRVKFKTRTGSGGRGFSADCLILDEAMILLHAFMAALGPTQSVRVNPQTIAMGSAGNKESEYFGQLRRQAMIPDATDITWMEWSAELCDDYCDEGCSDHDDPFSEETYAKSNPAYGIRLFHRAVEKDRRNLAYAEFVVERLSVGDWPQELDEFNVIDKESWNRQGEDKTLDIEGKMVFAITTAPDRLSTAITTAGHIDKERSQVLLEVTGNDAAVDQRAGTAWVVPRAIELWKKHKPYAFVIDTKGQAATFIEDLRDAGVKVISPQALEYAQACAQVAVGVVGTKNEKPFIYHLGQTELNMAVASVDKRPLMGLWAWKKATDASNIIALESATLAFWGLQREAQGRSRRNLWVM